MPAPDHTRSPRLVVRIAALGALAFSSATIAQYLLPIATFCEPGGGCDQVRSWAFSHPVAGVPLGLLLPALGLMGFATLFAGSLVAQRTTVRVTGALAVLGGVIAGALLVLQATTVGAWCWLCVGVDGFALVAGGAGAWLLVVAGHTDPHGEARLRSPWWAGASLALLGPLAWAGTLPDPEVPAAIRELYRPGAVNVVEVVDFECPYCRALHPALRSALGSVRGEVNLVRVVVPLSFHAHARDAARAYHCAARAGRAEPMADALFAANDVSRDATLVMARELHLDEGAFEACLDDGSIEVRIREDERLAERSNNQGLPTLYVGDRTMLGFDPASGDAAIRDALLAAQASDGGRVRVWPLLGVLAVAIGAFVLGRKR